MRYKGKEHHLPSLPCSTGLMQPGGQISAEIMRQISTEARTRKATDEWNGSIFIVTTTKFEQAHEVSFSPLPTSYRGSFLTATGRKGDGRKTKPLSALNGPPQRRQQRIVGTTPRKKKDEETADLGRELLEKGLMAEMGEKVRPRREVVRVPCEISFGDAWLGKKFPTSPLALVPAKQERQLFKGLRGHLDHCAASYDFHGQTLALISLSPSEILFILAPSIKNRFFREGGCGARTRFLVSSVVNHLLPPQSAVVSRTRRVAKI